MSIFIKVRGVDAMSNEDNANPIYLRPHNIIHIEPWDRQFGINCIAPNGQCMPTGNFKHVLGCMIVLAAGGQRVLYNSAEEVVAMIEEFENGYPSDG